MLQSKKTVGEAYSGRFTAVLRLAARPGLCAVLLLALLLADKSFSSSSARGGGHMTSAGASATQTNREAGAAFTTDPENGDRHFQTTSTPEQANPADVKIMPVQPWVQPEVPQANPPIIVNRGANE